VSGGEQRESPERKKGRSDVVPALTEAFQ